ncbi:type I-E CRISPR-associated protein Cse1/CasA [Methylobacterium nodulans]|uniref:CRISPR-associated protein, Cse1 family n=1 Tax=Methylobacterium nodulans (strain LMG 21967 / CNCM I-2342 / ORS 2060) TaxID=460265 RepID=B8IMR5_METNO|nr:type I-E CRISPR-associated protein Cse1/CasA [Methylobacterium nodulans]ACL60258.1 CRISPR-associated protein, Cse1 family [Methylobacterium nodulans ORS 2060]
MRPFSLLTEPWIPVLRADGTHACIRPAEITADIAANPVVAPAWGRPDLDAATREYWIALFGTACGSWAGPGAWREHLRHPPAPEVLDAAFAPLAPAFILDGEGPRFGQDLEDIAGETVPVGQLLIEAPGANTIKRNLDHFVRRGRVETLSRAGAAIALHTLQTYAPSGGAGHRVSVRGGGPLTTLLLPGPPRGGDPARPVPLWQTLWLATPACEASSLKRVFPWLAPTRTSEQKRVTTPSDVDPLQAFWGMPRRVRLVFEANTEGHPCDLTGRIDPVVVRAYRTRPHGTSYVGFTHPLSPHYRGKADEPFLPVHGQPGRVGYRHWVGLVVSDQAASPLRRPADAVTLGLSRLEGVGGPTAAQARLLATGYDMDNMKARAFIESEMPLHLPPPGRFSDLNGAVSDMIKGAYAAEGLLRTGVRAALFVKATAGDGFQNAPKGGGAIDLARARFWERTEAAFGEALAALSEDLADPNADALVVTTAAREAWRESLRRAAIDLFDDLVPLDDLDALDLRAGQARIEARSNLHLALHGYGKSGASFFEALGFEPPKPSNKRKERA